VADPLALAVTLKVAEADGEAEGEPVELRREVLDDVGVPDDEEAALTVLRPFEADEDADPVEAEVRVAAALAVDEELEDMLLEPVTVAALPRGRRRGRAGRGGGGCAARGDGGRG
jgi:hypothetical protein